MGGQQIGEEEIAAYAAQMRRADRAAGTRAKYLRDVRALRAWLAGRGLTQELLNDWRAELAGRYAAQTVNSMLAAANGFCSFMRWAVRARYLKVQRAAFRDAARELTRTDYERLLHTAEGSGQRRLALAMECLCATGVRVSELRYFTVEAARRGVRHVLLGHLSAENNTPRLAYETVHRRLVDAGIIPGVDMQLQVAPRGMRGEPVTLDQEEVCSRFKSSVSVG